MRSAEGCTSAAVGAMGSIARLLSVPTQNAQVRVLERVNVLKSVAQQSIDTNVATPYQTKCFSERRALKITQGDQNGGQWCRVRHIVKERADSVSLKVASTRKIRDEEKYGEKPPWFASMRKRDEGPDQEHRGFTT